MMMHMITITASWQVLSSLPGVGSSGVVTDWGEWSEWRPREKGWRLLRGRNQEAELDMNNFVHYGNVAERRWGEQVFRKYSPGDFPPRRERWSNYGLDIKGTKEPQKPLLSNFNKQPVQPVKPVKPNFQARPRPTITSILGGNFGPHLQITPSLPRFYTLREKLAKKKVLLELSFGAQIRV